MPKRAAQEEYDADGGFVEDAPKSKKSKGAKAASTNTSADAKTGRQEGADGEVYWAISSKKRLTVAEWKKTTLINIRDYYERDGKMLPGKGVAINPEQLNAIINILPELESELKSRGFDTTRPDYANALKKSTADKDDKDDKEEVEAVESGADESEDAEPVSKKSKSKLDKFKHKAKKNHEATSDEDDD